MSAETWKVFKPDCAYLISSYGRIWSIISKKHIKWYVHKSRANTYLRYTLRGNKHHMAHVAVAEHFKLNQLASLRRQNPDSDLQVDHIDGNTMNPQSNNIRFVTMRANINHMYAMKGEPLVSTVVQTHISKVENGAILVYDMCKPRIAYASKQHHN